MEDDVYNQLSLIADEVGFTVSEVQDQLDEMDIDYGHMGMDEIEDVVKLFS
jgi:hypothetical protein